MNLDQLIHAKERANRNGDNKALADWCLKLGGYYKAREEWDNALKEFEEYGSLNESNPDEYLTALRAIGETKIELTEYDEGLRYIRRYYESAQARGNELEIQRALTTLGRTYFIYSQEIENKKEKRKKLETADRFCREAFEAIPSICSSLEKKQMKACLYINRYPILYQLEKTEEADKIFDEGSHLMEEGNLQQELFNLLDIKSTLMTEKENYKEALEANRRASIALESLRNYPDFNAKKIETMLIKARIFIYLKNFPGAKSLLVTIYAMKDRKSEHWDEICRLLKAVYRIVELQDEIAKSEDSATLSKKNEKIGDICIDLEAHKVAIDFYKKALQIETSDYKRMSKLLYSIAQTYEEICLFKDAAKYYNMDLEICKNLDQKEKLPSLLGLAGCTEVLDKDVKKVKRLFIEAREIASSCKALSNEVDVLSNFLEFLKRIESTEKEEIEFELSSIKAKIDLNDEIASEDEGSNSDDSIDLEQVLAAEVEPLAVPRTKRILTKPKFVRNEKGESCIHELCQECDNYKNLEIALKTGLNPNVHDLLGYTPLHDACVGGFVDYVKLLIQYGANVNAKNGKSVTPLMDACAIASPQIIQLLLDSGADPNMLDLHSWNALDHLNDSMSKSREVTDDVRQVHSRLKLVTKIDPSVVKISTSAIETVNTDGDDDIIDDDLPRLRSRKKADRRSLQPSPSSKYKSGLKRNGFKSKLGSARANLRRSFDEESVIDVEKESSFARYSNKRKSEKLSGSNKKQRRSSKDDVSNTVRIEESDDDGDLTSEIAEMSNDREREPEIGYLDSTLVRSNSNVNGNVNVGHKIRLKITIDGKTMLVPMKPNETVDNLTSEIATRYLVASGQKPLLKLVTPQGVELHLEDSLGDIFGETCPEAEVDATVEGFDLAPMKEQYVAICTEMEIQPLENVILELEEAQKNGALVISQGSVRNVLPVVRSLHHQMVLIEVCLSGLNLGGSEDSFEALCEAIKSASNLKKLDFSQNCLQPDHLNQFLETVLKSDCSSALAKLTTLNLGFNDLGDESGEILMEVISSLPCLESLDLSYCHLTPKLFQKHNLFSYRFTSVNLAGNCLGPQCLDLILGFLDPASLVDLNIGNCCAKSGPRDAVRSLGLVLSKFARRVSSDVALKTLVLSRNNLNFEFVESFSKGLYYMGRLTTLDVSHNPGLNSQNILKLLQELCCQNVPVSHLSLHGCNRIDDDEIVDYITGQLVEVSITCRKDSLVNQIKNKWNHIWENSAKVATRFDSLTLSKISIKT